MCYSSQLNSQHSKPQLIEASVHYPNALSSTLVCQIISSSASFHLNLSSQVLHYSTIILPIAAISYFQ